MKKKVIIISLGGSLIIPKKLNLKFLKKFEKTINKNLKKYKFVVVCGGGYPARQIISILRKQRKSIKEQSIAGIQATKENAKLVIKNIGNKSNKRIPKSIKEIESQLKKKKIIFTGALRYHPNETSDTTSAKLAHFFKAEFINLSNVSGLYTSNPSTNKKAKFIPKISWKNFEKKALKIKYRPGQHFVLDQSAAKVIRKNKIKTYLLGKEMKELDNLLNQKKFKGTTIEG